jgi:glycosyltransferase involved in cell wall biosynthesis
MNPVPRIAFFTDSFHEVNGVAHTSRNFDAFARRRAFPFLNVHAGPKTRMVQDGPVWTLELKRGPVGISLEHDMSFDLLLLRYRRLVAEHLKEFGAELIHITGPSDIGILGALLAHQLGLPLIASWHTNIHEFGGRRLMKMLGKFPERFAQRIADFTETKIILALSVRYYQLARVLLAPNLELVNMLREGTKKPTFLMQRGVDTVWFSPEKRDRSDDVLTIGFVGRLSPEKNVRFLQAVAHALQQAGIEKFRISVVGEGHERGWLEQNVPNVKLSGMLFGEELARAYANMDIFAFPSHTDTFGNVVLEALASAVPTVVMPGGGPKYLVMDGVTGFIAEDDSSFVNHVVTLAKDAELREQMGRRAREFAICRHWNRIFDQVYDAYEYCLRSKRAVPLRPPVFA